MAIHPVSPIPADVRKRIFSRASLIFLLTTTSLFVLCLIFSWTTRDAMAHLHFLSNPGGVRTPANSHRAIVDLRPWQTAEALAPLAVTTEETEYAHEAERLADHEVDQAFASALRMASAEAHRGALTGDAPALSQRVDQLQQTVKDDQALVKNLPPATGSQAGELKGSAQPTEGDDDLEVAKAQLGLDSDQLADAQQELDRASGDDRAQIQSELAAHEALMRKFDSAAHDPGQVAVLSARKHGTLASRLTAWSSQLDRNQLIKQAIEQAQANIASLTSEYRTLETNAKETNSTALSASSDRASRLSNIEEKEDRRQLLIICGDRIETQQQLSAIYGKWSVQILLQHRILLHLILQSLATIAFILICIVLCDALIRRLMANPALDRRQMQTLRTLLQLAIQVVGGLLILLVVFGWPRQMSTILGLATAGLTIAMQDFILAFFGWFILMGKNGIRVGDWVEINGVGGEVTEMGPMSTTLLETGDLADKGHPTGRRITFINSFAIRGQYFNFSTTGQWMWDEITVSLPTTRSTEPMVECILKAVQEETKEATSVAEQEWKRGTRDDGLSRFSAVPVVNSRPSGSGIDIRVRYVTRASERFAVRNRLYQHVIDLLQTQSSPAEADEAHAAVSG